MNNNKQRILIVDDEPLNIDILTNILKGGYDLQVATYGNKALQLSRQHPRPNLIILDIMMPDMDGFEVIDKLKADESTKNIPVIFITALTGKEDEYKGLELGAVDYITKPIAPSIVTARVKTHLRLYEHEQELERLVAERTDEVRHTMGMLETANDALRKNFYATVKSLTYMTEMRAGMIAGHSRRVAELAKQLGRILGLNEEEQNDLFLAGLLHDFGKIAIPDKIVNKPVNTLSGEEFKKYATHPVLGETALMSFEKFGAVARIIRGHHEQYDGTGFPDKLKGDQIHLQTRILSVVNDYDALQHGGISTLRLTQTDAAEYLVRHSGTKYDPHIVKALLNNEGLTHTNFEKERAVCIKSNILRPGMVLMRDLISHENLLLLSKGHVIDNTVIHAIETYERAAGVDFDIYVNKY